MKSRKTVVLLGLGALAPVLGQPAAAQVVAAQPGFIAVTKASVVGCPNIGWRLARHPDSTVTGIAYYADATGASQVTGTSENGKFTLQLVSMMGKGPVGTVTGERDPNGGLVADLKGEGCANLHLAIQPVPDMNGATGG